MARRVQLYLVLVACVAAPGCKCETVPKTCGNGTCDPGETADNCPEECTAGVDGGTDSSIDICPFQWVDRVLIQDAITIAVGDTLIGLRDSGQFDVIAASLQLLDAGWASSQVIMNRPPCTGTFTEVPICSEDRPGINVCTRLGCEGMGVHRFERYMTIPPITDPMEAHSFDYPASGVAAGSGTYDPNPYVYWRIDKWTPDVASVSADIDHSVVIEPNSGEVLDMSHSGSVSGSLDMTTTTLTAFALDLTFSGLDAGILTASASLDATGGVTGGVELGALEVATFSTPFDATTNLLLQIPLQWIAECLD